MAVGFPDTGRDPRVPVVILCDPPASCLRVAALTVLDRLVVAAHRAGAGPITLVTREVRPPLARATALGIAIQTVPEPPRREQAALWMRADCLVQTVDLRNLLSKGGRLATAENEPLPVGVLPAGEGAWELALRPLPTRVAEGVALPVPDAAAACAAERKLWASLGSSSDGWVDRVFNRPCGRPLSRFLIHTPITPNAVSLASVGIGLAAAWCFAQGHPGSAVLGAVLFQLSAVIDCVDGDLARVLFKESPLGKWIDLVGDQVVHLAVFAGIALGVMRSGSSPFAGVLGASAMLGAAISFAVILRGMRQPAAQRSSALQRMIDATTNRDFSVLVLLLAWVGRLEWFLWMSALGSHLFWMTALALQFGGRSAGKRTL